MTPPPTSEAELLRRARALAGRALADVAAAQGVAPPGDAVRTKGWAGQLIEHVLGATAGSKAEPDFPHLGVELKTLPVTAEGRPRESTYVCTAPLDGRLERSWAVSWVCRKLARVLWLPLVGDGPLAERRVGAAVLWSPDADEAEILRRDWELLAELVAAGQLWQLDARHGAALHLRPKAAHSGVTTWVTDEHGEAVRDTPRGFYLRPSFTAEILRKHLRVA